MSFLAVLIFIFILIILIGNNSDCGSFGNYKCPICNGDLKYIGKGEYYYENEDIYKCEKCGKLHYFI